MAEGVREPAIAAGLTDPDRFEEGIQALHRTTGPDGVFCYTFSRNRAQGLLNRSRGWPTFRGRYALKRRPISAHSAALCVLASAVRFARLAR
jgi:hypothetical protein